MAYCHPHIQNNLFHRTTPASEAGVRIEITQEHLAALGITLDVAKTEARKKTAGTRKNPNAPGGIKPTPEAQWPVLVAKRISKNYP